MKILVTGGFGFIGTHLVEELVKDPENEVIVVDNLQSNPIPYSQFLKEINQPPNLRYEIMALRDYVNSHPYKRFDVIYHLASPVGPAGVLQYAGRMVGMVVNDIIALVGLAKRTNAKLIDVSTSEIYGGGKEGLCSEEFDRIVPAKMTIRLEYAIAKLAAEAVIINTCKVSDLKAAIVRPFNVAGPRQSGKGGFVLPRFLDQAIRGEPLTVFGDGTQIRAFTHVKDIVRGLMLVAEKSPMNGTAWNVGNPMNKTRIIDLAYHVLTATGSISEIQFVDPKTIYGDLYAEAAEKYPDASKIISDLGWEPSLGVVDTIYDAYQYIMENYEEI